MPSLALAKNSLSGYVLISVCKPSRPTSWRPRLMSSIARLYSTLSGSAVLSALVDLFTFFFLCRIWASLELALSSNPAINVHVNVHVRVRRKYNVHLSLENLPPPTDGLGDPFCSVFPVYLNQRTGFTRNLPAAR